MSRSEYFHVVITGFLLSLVIMWDYSNMCVALKVPVLFPKTVDLPCFPFRAAVFIHLKSLFAARF